MSRNRGGWTDASLDYLSDVIDVLDELEEYHPLTLRQVYYQLVASETIENKIESYRKLSRILTKARIDGYVSWSAIEDRAREIIMSHSDASKFEYVDWQTEQYLSTYKKDLQQSQKIRLEIWVEKDALSRICHKVAQRYSIHVVVARGFSSVSFLHDARLRINEYWKNGQYTKILYFGDLDPSGWAMLPAMMLTLQEELKCGNRVDAQRCALLPIHIHELNLPHSPEALKEGDPRAAAYREIFGDIAVELDAIAPKELENIITCAIESNLDMRLFNEQVRIQKREMAQIAVLKHDILKIKDLKIDEWLK